MLELWTWCRRELAQRAADPVTLLTWLCLGPLLVLLAALLLDARAPHRPRGRLLLVGAASGSEQEALVEVLRDELDGTWLALERRQGDSIDSAFEELQEGRAAAVLVLGAPALRWARHAQPDRADRITIGLLELLQAELSVEHDGTQELRARLGAWSRRLSDLRAAQPAALRGTPLAGEVPFSRLVLPGALALALLAAALGTSGSLWRERERHTLARACATGRGAWPLVGGQVLAGALLGAAIGTVGVAFVALRWGLGGPEGCAPAALFAALAWCLLSGACLRVLFLGVQELAASQRGGAVAANALVLPLAVAGGCLLPSELLPDGLWSIGRWSPVGLTRAGLASLLGRDAAALSPGLALGFTCALLLLGSFALVRSVEARPR